MIDGRCVDDLNDTELGIYNSIIMERDRQTTNQQHDQYNLPVEWVAILAKQLGQVSEQAVRDDLDSHRLEKQLIQIAAVSVAWLEVLEKVRLAREG